MSLELAGLVVGMAGVVLAGASFLYARQDRGADERREAELRIDGVAKTLQDHRLENERSLRGFVTRGEFERLEGNLDTLKDLLTDLRIHVGKKVVQR